MVKRHRAWLIVPLALVLLIGVAVAWSAGAAQGSNYANDPFCQNLQGAINALPPSKSAALVKFCDNRAHDLANGGPPSIVPRTPSPFPTGVATVYGIQPPMNDEPWESGGTYSFINMWLGQSAMVFAGALSSDPSQGLVVLTDRGTVSNGASLPPSILGTYQTPTKDGALTITAANGEVLTLMAADGANYTFDVASPGLVRQ
jgi:hypothetical protein